MIEPQLDITNCDTWFYTVFSNNATDDTKQYWGSNPGTPWDGKPYTYGMIDGRKNMISMPCSQVNRTVPYFKDFDKENINKFDSKYKNVDDFLIDEIVKLS